ncbi:MAG: hypothetical protein IJF32_13905 [Oscillospiraceae bacterium]|nr:hypothetical protein [Oscillospiraceae bacterium]
MFIDISTYIGHWPFRRLINNSLDALDSLAQKHGITHMVVANLNGFFYKDANDANLELLEELERYSGKTEFLPLAVVNPAYPEWEKDAHEMIKRGFAGFELAPVYHKYSLAPEMLYDEYSPKHRALEVINLAEELDVPVRICASFENNRGRSELDSYTNLNSDDYFALLSKNRNTHVFVTSFSPFMVNEKFSQLLKTRKNTYFDATCFGSDIIDEKISEGVLKAIDREQLCYGSLSPFNYMEPTLLKFELAKGLDFEAAKTASARAFKSLR